ncbi:hypothetical protein [Methanococcus voltae]|uniref:Uncharacterized protein n=2 Tax=Methanococcus voltae TaxID=2188 RepID=A0A8J7RG85_METVO|nr:hypothetical protein [Methanococcus voltae]MBP2172078.1 hypothetical protein [Methanococcus voltae]MBP2200965.1 hypothetical protein [Methanococcus voltae]MCS3921689.1 hypothetical protein [Methanococcus voltae PS]
MSKSIKKDKISVKSDLDVSNSEYTVGDLDEETALRNQMLSKGIVDVSKYAKRRGVILPVYLSNNSYAKLCENCEETSYFSKLYGLLKDFRLIIQEEKKPFIMFRHSIDNETLEFMAILYNEDSEKAWYLVSPEYSFYNYMQDLKLDSKN